MTDKKTLEQALAEMEASNTKAAELKSKNFPELIAEAVARTALNARLAALPQAQRRKVLNAAGLNYVSSAPPPIEPIRGSSHTLPRATIAPRAIEWPFWKAMRTVKLWQACALIVNLDPDILKRHPQAWMAAPGSGPLFDERSFPSAEVKTTFEKTLRLAETAVSYMNGPIFPEGTPNSGSKAEKDVFLGQVVTFLTSREWPEIPKALQSLASHALTVETEPKDARQDRRLMACIDAGLKMDKAALSRLPNGVGEVADKEGISRQSFSTDVKAALERKMASIKAGGSI